MSRQEKRKESKKQKRKQQRQQAAYLSAQQQEEVEVDTEAVIQQEREEDEALARERAEHDEQERLWLLREEEAQIEWLRKQEEEKEVAERKRKEEERRLQSEGGEEELEEGWEYVEDGPAEIIWQGNEIIVKKPRKKVRKGTHSGASLAFAQDKKRDGPTSNPLPPQSAAFSSYQADTQDVAADQSTNFGTEKDQRNCPFYIKTGVCLFGVRCSRLHPVFNEACTLLMRSMYTGAGLALEPVESLEAPMYLHTSFTLRRSGQILREKEAQPYDYTDEEVVQEFEEFYDDVHSEFIQFGEIVNFKVCRNSSPHLRGNVYVHYVSQESAMAAYNHMNGRFYAKKQISCEFVGVRKWKLAICGEFMRTYYKTCSRGTSCNFLHCFENPRGEYEWADMDRPAPRFWQRKMAKLFGHARVSDEEADEKSRTDHRGRHREVVYDDDRRRSKHTRDSRGDRERKYYDHSYEDETKDRTERASSKYNDRHRGRQSRRRDNKDGRHSSTYEDDSANCSLREDEPGCINDERWIAGDDHPETDDRDRRRERRHRSTSTHDEHHDHPGRYSPTVDHVYHHRSSHHRSTRRSRSPSSHKVRRSRSRDRSTSHMARSPDGNEEEQEDRYLRPTRHKKERASKERERHRHSGKAVDQLASDRLDRVDRRGDDEVGKSQSFDIHPGIERHQRASKVVELEDVKRKDLAGMLSEEIGTSVVEKKVAQEGSGVEMPSSVVDLSTDEVQKSTSEWQSWRKTTKVKLGLKEKPMRLII